MPVEVSKSGKGLIIVFRFDLVNENLTTARTNHSHKLNVFCFSICGKRRHKVGVKNLNYYYGISDNSFSN